MICASCGETTPTDPCSACDRSPLLEGRYRLQRLLGQGAVGTTYAASRLSDGAVVAIKEMPLRRAETDKARQLLEREVALLRQLDHPGIPSHIDDFLAGRGKHRALYLVQEYIDGRALSAELADRRLDEAGLLDILTELLGIFAYLHSLRPPVIHRDVKPDNVMRRGDGRLVLIDFGAARDAVKDPDLGGSTVAGTFGFMAPEQFAGDATPATDIYALGVLAVVLLTRQEARGLADRGTLEDWLTTAHVSPPLRALLADMTATDPDDRPASAEAVRRRIAQLRSTPIRSAPRRPAPRPPKPRPSAPPVLPPPEPLPPPIATDAGAALRGPLILAGLLVAGMATAIMMVAEKEPPSAPAVSVAAVEAEAPPASCDGPCRPLSEGQLKGVQLGMTLAEATAAFPALSEADAQPTERVHASGNALDPSAFFDALDHAISLPGHRLVFTTTLLEQPAECDFQFATEERASRLHCALTQTSPSQEVHQRLTDSLSGQLTARYGPGRTLHDDSMGALGGFISEDWSEEWSGGGDTLLLTSSFSQLMEMSPTSALEVTFTSAAHAALLTELSAQAQTSYEAARAEEVRKAAEEARRLEEALEAPGAADGDL